uniref:Uncharacterized protein n=1 Tax=Cacopsylla melanoneura TaxID=428564 RepID=A0A8D8VQP0_9HEMI
MGCCRTDCFVIVVDKVDDDIDIVEYGVVGVIFVLQLSNGDHSNQRTRLKCMETFFNGLMESNIVSFFGDSFISVVSNIFNRFTLSDRLLLKELFQYFFCS